MTRSAGKAIAACWLALKRSTDSTLACMCLAGPLQGRMARKGAFGFGHCWLLTYQPCYPPDAAVSCQDASGLTLLGQDYPSYSFRFSKGHHSSDLQGWNAIARTDEGICSRFSQARTVIDTHGADCHASQLPSMVAVGLAFCIEQPHSRYQHIASKTLTGPWHRASIPRRLGSITEMGFKLCSPWARGMAALHDG